MKFVNEEALPSHYGENGGHICEKTAGLWLKLLGFSAVDEMKKGVYIDGHEREDVVAYRTQFVQTYYKYKMQGMKIIFQDETVFMSNDGQRRWWVEKGTYFSLSLFLSFLPLFFC